MGRFMWCLHYCLWAFGTVPKVPKAEKQLYEKPVLKLLKAIYDQRSDRAPECDVIIQNCSTAYHDEAGRHMTMAYADYFFIEALYNIYFAHKPS